MSRFFFLALLGATMVVAGYSGVALADEVKCDGTITKIEGENVTVKDATQEQQMKVTPATRLTSGGKPMMPTELKVGQKVRCVGDKKEGVMVCTTMEVMRQTP
jgi:hypothetical protein